MKIYCCYFQIFLNGAYKCTSFEKKENSFEVNRWIRQRNTSLKKLLPFKWAPCEANAHCSSSMCLCAGPWNLPAGNSISSSFWSNGLSLPPLSCHLWGITLWSSYSPLGCLRTVTAYSNCHANYQEPAQ